MISQQSAVLYLTVNPIHPHASNGTGNVFQREVVFCESKLQKIWNDESQQHETQPAIGSTRATWLSQIRHAPRHRHSVRLLGKSTIRSDIRKDPVERLQLGVAIGSHHMTDFIVVYTSYYHRRAVSKLCHHRFWKSTVTFDWWFRTNCVMDTRNNWHDLLIGPFASHSLSTNMRIDYLVDGTN